jgi:hypothetical protein
VALAFTPLVVPLGLVAALGAGAWARGRVRRARAVLTDAAPLDLAARVLCDAYATLGELTPEAAGSLTIEPRASGYLRLARAGDAPRKARSSPGASTSCSGRWRRHATSSPAS